MTPGDSVETYRKNAGFTQAELGKKLGKFSRQNISDIEHGRREISKELARKLSVLFGISIDRFI
jgi:transcriptional regulator with XRE-family HTH domain